MGSGINWFYGLIVLLFVAMLYISAKFFKGSSSSAVGIAQAKEYKINSEKASLVKGVAVVPGQQVKAGDPLMELSSSELEIEIDKLTTRISIMKAEREEKAKMVESDIAYIRADEGVAQEELVAEIEQTKGELQLNRELTRSFTKDTVQRKTVNPLQIKINSLQTQHKRLQQSIDIRVSDLQKKHAMDQVQQTNQIRLLEQELDLMHQEKKKLSKFAVADGVIGNVFIKEGEQVNAFTPLLSIIPLQPTTVTAYLIGNKNVGIGVGSSVSIVPFGGAASTPVKGKVIGYGSVAELPEILQKSTAVKAFGREVFIEIDRNNSLANGQKVLIR
jgi:multidrug resistance efflux pump